MFIFLIALPLLVVLNLVLSRRDTERFKRAMGSPDQLYGMKWEYGPPDADESTAHDEPRPPIVTRYIEYRDVDVRVVFVPNAKLGAAPPYSGWKYAGAIAISNEKSLTPHELEDRLAKLPPVEHHPKNILSQAW